MTFSKRIGIENRSIIAILVSIAILYLIVPSASAQPRWCNSSRLNPTEATICKNDKLGQLDYRLNRSYRNVFGPGPLTSEQLAWLSLRNECIRNASCIGDRYRERIGQLSLLQRGSTGKVTLKNFNGRPNWCSSNRLNPTEATICSTRELQTLDNQIVAVYRGIYGAGPLNAGQLSWLYERNRCSRDVECIGSAYVSRTAFLLGELGVSPTLQRAVAPPPQLCSPEYYEKQMSNCYIVFGAEAGCSGVLSGELGELSGRSAVSSALCSVAMQDFLTGEINWIAAGISTGAGVADDLAESYMEYGTENNDIASIIIGGLFQLGSYGAMAGGLLWCESEVKRQCGY